MKKILLWPLVLLISVSMIAVFSLASCKKEASPEEESPAEEEVAKEVTAEEEVEEIKEKPYEGTTITILTCETPLFSVAFEDLKEDLLEKEGIILDWTHIPFGDFNTKLELSLREEGGKYDLVVWPQNLGSRMKGQGYFEPLEPYINNAELTPSDWDYEDFVPKVMENFVYPEDGGLIAIPIVTNSLVLFYRTDLFEEAGLEPPTTWDDYLNYAEKLNNPDNEVYGNIIMAQGDADVQLGWIYMAILSSLEGEQEGAFLYDSDTYEPTLNTPEGHRAAEILMAAMKYAPPDAIGYDWMSGQEAMQLGKGAMFMQWCNSKGMYQDPEVSVVVDKVMTALIPGSSHPLASSWEISILSDSKSKDAAWAVMKYMNDKEHSLKYALDTRTMWTSVRKSIKDNPELLAVWPDFPVIQDQLSKTIPVPIIEGYMEIESIINRRLAGMVQELTTMDETLTTMDNEIRQVMVDNGYLEE